MDGPLVLVAAVFVVRVGRDFVKVNVQTAGVQDLLEVERGGLDLLTRRETLCSGARVPLTARLEVVEQALNRGERVSTRRPSLSRCGDGEDGDEEQMEESHGRS